MGMAEPVQSQDTLTWYRQEDTTVEVRLGPPAVEPRSVFMGASFSNCGYLGLFSFE